MVIKKKGCRENNRRRGIVKELPFRVMYIIVISCNINFNSYSTSD